METLRQLHAALGEPVLLRRMGTRAIIARWRHNGGVFRISADDAARVTTSLGGRRTLAWSSPAGVLRATGAVGSASVYAPGQPGSLAVTGPADVVQILLAPALVDEVRDRSGVSIQPHFQTQDTAVRRHTLRAFVAASRDDPDDTVLMEQSLLALAARVGGHQTGPPVRGALSATARKRVQDLLACRIEQATSPPITLGEMAAAAELSAHHFVKLFRASFGTTPYAYTLDQRLSRAMQLLGVKRMSDADAADAAGFGTPAHFVASFRRRLGVTPGAYRSAVLA